MTASPLKDSLAQVAKPLEHPTKSEKADFVDSIIAELRRAGHVYPNSYLHLSSANEYGGFLTEGIEQDGQLETETITVFCNPEMKFPNVLTTLLKFEIIAPVTDEHNAPLDKIEINIYQPVAKIKIWSEPRNREELDAPIKLTLPEKEAFTVAHQYDWATRKQALETLATQLLEHGNVFVLKELFPALKETAAPPLRAALKL